MCWEHGQLLLVKWVPFCRGADGGGCLVQGHLARAGSCLSDTCTGDPQFVGDIDLS